MQDDEHLLSFVTDKSGTMVSIHTNLRGVNQLIEELTFIRDQLLDNDCPHTHLFTVGPCPELTSTKLSDQEVEENIVCHVKIYGWNSEWAERHGLVGANENP